jgi:hypothetical protein
MSAAAASLKAEAAAQGEAVAAAMALCQETPELTAYPGCIALTATQPSLSGAIEALAQRQAAAEAAWLQERPRLEEAAALLALSGT